MQPIKEVTSCLAIIQVSVQAHVSIYRLRILIPPKTGAIPLIQTGTSFSAGSHLLACLSSHPRPPQSAHLPTSRSSFTSHAVHRCSAELGFMTLFLCFSEDHVCRKGDGESCVLSLLFLKLFLILLNQPTQ